MNSFDLKSAIKDEIDILLTVASEVIETDPKALPVAGAARLLLAVEKARTGLTNALRKTRSFKCNGKEGDLR